MSVMLLSANGRFLQAAACPRKCARCKIVCRSDRRALFLQASAPIAGASALSPEVATDVAMPTLTPEPAPEPALAPASDPAAQAVEAAAASGSHRSPAPQPRRGTPRPARSASPRPSPTEDQPVPPALVRDDTLVVQNSEAQDLQALARRILEHPLLAAQEPVGSASVAASSPDAAHKQLRVAALSGRAVCSTLDAIAVANASLASSGYQLQVSAALRKPANVPASKLMLRRDALSAFLFVCKVKTDSIPPAPAAIIKVGSHTDHIQCSQIIVEALVGPQPVGMVMSCIGFTATLLAFKGVIHAHGQLVSGRYQSAKAEPEASPAPGYGPHKRLDVAMVPTHVLEVDRLTREDGSSEGGTVAVTRLQLVNVPPPPPVERQLRTTAQADEVVVTGEAQQGGQAVRGRQEQPRQEQPMQDQPRRVPSPRPASRARTPTPSRNSPTPSRNSPTPSRNSLTPARDTITVSAEEWNSMKLQIASLARQQQELMRILQQFVAPGGSQGGQQHG